MSDEPGLVAARHRARWMYLGRFAVRLQAPRVAPAGPVAGGYGAFRWLTVLVLAGVLLAGCGGGDDASTPGHDLQAESFASAEARPPGLAMPNPELTPGDVFSVTAAEICVKGYSSRVRNVSSSTRERVYRSYGITVHPTGAYEVDHLIPLELGGSNDTKNLWPEPAEPRPGFHEKDQVENRLHQLVCDGSLDLATAQQAIATDWYAAWVKYR